MDTPEYIIKWSKLVFVIAMKEQKVPWGGQMKNKSKTTSNIEQWDGEREEGMCYILSAYS